MFYKIDLKVDTYERQMRFEVLTDLVGSYYIHMKGDKRHSRLSDTLLWGDMTTIARDGAIVDKDHREHVVPLSFIFDHCFGYIKDVQVGDTNGMTEIGIRRAQWESDGTRRYILKFLIESLVTVIIPKEVANRLDSEEVGLKVSMPDNWLLGDCIIDRLRSVYSENDSLESLRAIYRDYVSEYKL